VAPDGNLLGVLTASTFAGRLLRRLTTARSRCRMNTLGRSIHVRGKGCAHDHDRGSDIKGELETARFSGDFLAVWDSFPVGPVTDAPDWIAQRARFHADTGTVRDVDYDAFLAELTDADRRLAASSKKLCARNCMSSQHEQAPPPEQNERLPVAR
jgi:hypothetical protein